MVEWWKKSIVYQIYPKSFYDTNNDGIGDIRGIIEKLSYLNELGIDVIWICPIYSSPMSDNGYDISDYEDINEIFGRLEDLDELILRAKEYDIKIIMDLVVNHSSDEHKWFIESRKSKNNPYRDYYYWRPPAIGGGPPNNWRSIFGGSAWEFDEVTGEYYLHVFGIKQPDLNWENSKVRDEVINIVKWWMDKGIAGFRIDAITYIKKQQEFSNLPGNPMDELVSINDASLNQPGIHEFLDELNEKAFSKYDIMTVAEAPGVPPEELDKYIGDNGHFSMLFDFSYTDLDLAGDGFWFSSRDWNVSELKNALTNSQLMTQNSGWGAVYLENHDQPRSLNKYIKEEDISEKSAKMLAGFYFLLRGTPFIYQGQEIGMTNVKYDSIEQYDDISSKDQYYSALKNGYSEQQALEVLWRRSRDNSRTPMQWDDSLNAGFTKYMPWLNINPNYKKINVRNAINNKDSIFYFYKKLIKLRKSSCFSDILTYGAYEPVIEKNENVIAYLRVLSTDKILVISNFRGFETEIEFPYTIKKQIISNSNQVYKQSQNILLKPYDFVAFEIE